MGADIFWNIQWGKKESIAQFWWPVLREYLRIDDRYLNGRIRFMMVQVHDIGLLGFIDKVKYSRSPKKKFFLKFYFFLNFSQKQRLKMSNNGFIS